MSREKWWLMYALIGMLWTGIFCYHIGKQAADHWYAAHPVAPMIGKGWARFLLMREDGTWHCLALGQKP